VTWTLSIQDLTVVFWVRGCRSTGDLDVVEVNLCAPDANKPDAHQQVGDVVAICAGGDPALGDNVGPVGVAIGSARVVVPEQNPIRAPVIADLGDLVTANPDCGVGERIPVGESG